MNSKYLVICVAAVTLAGCASMVDKYVEPDAGPMATMRFVAKSPLGGNIFITATTSEGECGSNAAGVAVKNARIVGVLHGMALAHGRKKLGLPLSEQIDEKDFTEVSIPARERFAFDVHLLSTSAGGFVTGAGGAPGTYVPSITGCNVTMDFLPEEGKQYEAVFTVDTNQKRCFVSVASLVRNSVGVYTREPERTMHAREPQCRW